MTIEKLIEIAKSCGSGSCSTKCKHFSRDGSSCRLFLLKDIAEKLEQAMEDVAVNCSTCKHQGNGFKAPPCSLCEPFEFNKWQWKGDAE